MADSQERSEGDVAGRVLSAGRRGIGSFHTPERLVGELRAAHPQDSKDMTVGRLIRLHCTEGALQGAASGLGGIFTLVITLPLSLFAGGVIQARLAYAIALVYGHDLDSAETESTVAHCLTGGRGTSATAAGVSGPRALTAALRRKAVRGVGTRLLTRVGGEGAARLIPVAGAAVAGAMDYGFTHAVATRAVEAFRR